MVVTGREGQIVSSLIERSPDGVEVVALGRPQLDLAGQAEAIAVAIAAERPDLIVSAAAYTQVDKAESEPDMAFAVNEQGVRAVAQAARKLSVPLIHLSTDYVFDGSKSSPYSEDDVTHPSGVYGASKLAGEQAVLAEHGNSVVLRTAWVYSPFGSNFVKTMLRLAASRDEVAVVAEQRGNPTSALDIADGIFTVATHLIGSDLASHRGLFHMAGSGDASWAQLADAIFAASTEAGGPAARVKHIGAADYPTAARRPANSQLDCDRLARVHGIRLPPWRASVKEVVARLVQPATAGVAKQ